MTTDAGRVCLWLGCSVLLSGLSSLVYSCATANSMRQGDRLDVSRYPQDIQDAYQVFSVRCSRCHTLARPLNARIHDAQHWVRYVARMRLNPSSGINAKDGEIILHFLLYYMHQQDQERHERDEPVEGEADPVLPDAPEAPEPAAVPPLPDAASTPAPDAVPPTAAPEVKP
jgi:hypothetical protein